MPNGSHAEADRETSAEPEQMDEAAQVVRQLLLKAAPLAGVWGTERFGLADVTVLKLIEALPGTLSWSMWQRLLQSSLGWMILRCSSDRGPAR